MQLGELARLNAGELHAEQAACMYAQVEILHACMKHACKINVDG